MQGVISWNEYWENFQTRIATEKSTTVVKIPQSQKKFLHDNKRKFNFKQ